MPQKRKYDWDKIKLEYITDPEASLRSIADKYGIKRCYVANKSKEQGWYALRKKHQQSVWTKALTKTANKQARVLEKEIEFLTMMKSHMGRMLKDDMQFNRHLIQVSSVSPDEGAYTTTEERIFDKMDARAMKDAMSTIEMMEKMTRSLYNQQKSETIQKNQIENARLQLERERFEFEKQKAEFARPDSTNIIRIDGIEKGWDE